MRLIHSLLPVISAAMVSAQAEYDALEARALFIGTDSSDPMASGPAVFRDPHNLPSAVASMVWFLANKAMFCPREAEVFTDPLAYDNFLVALNQFRGFTQSRTREIKVQLSGNLNMFVEEILQQAQDEVLEGVATEMGPGRDVTMKETAVALRGLIPPFVEDRSWKHWALTTIVIKRTEKGREGDEDGEGQGSRVILETSKLVLRLSREPHSGVTGLEPQPLLTARLNKGKRGSFL
ncbi:hypothetical protein BC939DRAFT_476064 [Gamsiella multidivaricata]|uniref:uncharacterized protein n=1 Tax=Gamsiella multidivaricata TaxID=101098 RepID=UPI0022204FB6|nr:uncharacterized protein BC939DRAFT_476064 [Gamsiella multidivaricata]KAI7825613.1 hypothetical protein BC939DRAFT_476064 [Gamsiella multidivaricata]